ncbi:unnamed protein product [Gongylonema pulchrum]|uniref:Cytochrome c oxidase assembly protein n=1 Tax=Gongylonema pulchrum TaxID=637853 RepID=A0A183ELC9_9BILA|nr:unnamed protein product [Gongylonema pulchrum]
MKQNDWFVKLYANQYRAENARTPIITFVCGVGVISLALVLYNRYCLNAKKLPDGEAVDFKIMFHLKKYIPFLRNFGIHYREFSSDDF